jgi:predicted small lipoprotein YifL
MTTDTARALAATLMLTLATAACGLKGDLYIPEAEAPAATAEPAQATADEAPAEEEAVNE